MQALASKVSGCPAQRLQSRCPRAFGTARLPNLRPAQASRFQDEFYDIGQQLEALKVKLETSSGSAPVPAVLRSSELNSLGYVCDEFGCVLLNASDAESKSPAGEDDEVALETTLAGQNWSIGLNSETPDGQGGYCAEVGGVDWSVSLTAVELNDFVTALKALRGTVRKLSSAEGQDVIRVKWDTKTVKLEAVCDRALAAQDLFGLKIEVGGLRTVRVSWPGSVVHEVLKALDESVPRFALAAPAPAAAAAPAPAPAVRAAA